MMKLKGIIFDLDGTLVTSSLDFSIIRQQINCPERLDVLAFVDGLSCATTKAHANSVIAWHEQQDALSAQALPGIMRLFDALEQAQLPSAIVTRNSQSASALKVANNRIPIQLVLTREDYPPKPAPDALLAIASLWQLEPQSILYVGDYLYDIQAAGNAGMQSCFINHGRDIDYQTQADIIITHLDELTAMISRAKA